MSNVVYMTLDRFVGYRFGDDGSAWSRLKKVGLGKGRGTKHVIGNAWRKLAPNKKKHGYLVVTIRSVDGVRKGIRLHRLILEAFVGPCPEGMECRHLDGDKTNNRLDNICWGTKEENIQDNFKYGRYVSGEDHPNALFSIQQVGIIRRMVNEEGLSRRAVARKYGVSKITISRIASGLSYA